MATYKLIQDIEAEDHILGPLTLRQFVFALITAFLIYIDFILVVKGVPFMLLLFGPPTLLTGFFAVPFGRDQPTEVWALAKFRFWFKPRKRLWDQTGMKDLVTVTAPKKVERVYTDGLTQTEVKSRLKALANTIDTRGWAVKNLDTPGFANVDATSDRLVAASTVATPQQVVDDPLPDDIMDTNTASAQQLTNMMYQSAEAHRQELVDQISAQAAAQTPVAAPAQPATIPLPPAPAAPAGNPANPQAQADYWFMNPGSLPTVQVAAPSAVDPTNEEQALLAHIKASPTNAQVAYGHLPVLQPSHPAAATPAPASPVPSPPPADPAILSLANNNDLDVATLAREAHKSKGDDEVVVALH
ncbi:MAG TPA: PrgI family protein [Candidatus Saccharimonadales bacterium]|nr:PrgI family protein [Candidatus Saccharimonadales bacterium]